MPVLGHCQSVKREFPHIRGKALSIMHKKTPIILGKFNRRSIDKYLTRTYNTDSNIVKKISNT